MEASDELNKTGPNYFDFYTHQVADLLSEDAVCELPREIEKMDTSKPRKTGKTAISFKNDSPLFSNGIGSGLSDYKREKLKGLLTESVPMLTQEVDELLDPIIETRKLIYQLNKQSYLGAASQGDGGKPPSKKPKISSSTCTSDVPMQATNARSRLNKNEERESLLESQVITEIENEEMSDDLKLLMENKEQSLETLKRYSDELFSTLEHMEQKLDGLLNTIVQKSRVGNRKTSPRGLGLEGRSTLKLEGIHPSLGAALTSVLGMNTGLTKLQGQQATSLERKALKMELRTKIEKLSSQNLGRVVEIIQHGKSSVNEHFIDLEEVDNLTLWRLYYYVEAVVNAGKLTDKTRLLL